MFKLLRITTVPISLKTLLKGQHSFMSNNGFVVIGVSSQGSELDDVRNNENIRTVALEMTRTISPLKDLKAVWNFYRLCKREKPMIVHSHTPKAGLVGMLGAKFADVPIRLHTVAGMPLMEARGMKRKVLDFVEKITYAAATRVYPNSGKLFDFIVENGYTTMSKLKVIGNGSSNGVNTSFFDQRLIADSKRDALKTELKIYKESFVFIFVGRVVGDKGINELVAAFTQYQEIAKRNVKLLLVGGFESDLDPLKFDTLYEIKNNPGIVSVGFQNDVRPYFAISDALVFPSYREGFPNVVMQAGAMGLPSIVSDINGCNEIIVEGENGSIVPVKESSALLTAMQKMTENKDYYQGLKSKARAMIKTRYEQEVVWEALMNEYLELLEKEGNHNV